jgi:PAS domain S-box-containing protein
MENFESRYHELLKENILLKQQLSQSESNLQREISESASKFKSFFDHISEGAIILNAANASFVDFNDRVCAQLGYTREEFSNLTIHDIEASETHDEILQHIDYIIKSGRHEFETRHRTKNGEIKNILVSAWVCEISGKQVYYCVYRDITDIKRSESELITAKNIALNNVKQFKGLFELATDAIFIAEASTGTILDVNKAGCNLLQLSPEKIIGRKQSTLHPELTNHFQSHVTTVRNGSVPSPVENVVISSDGTRIPVEIVAARVIYQGKECLMGIFRDISARKQNEEFRDMFEKKLKHSHDLMQYVIEHSRSAIAVHDRELRYIYVSQRYLREYNVKEKDVLGRHHYEIFPDLPQKWRDVHQLALRGVISSAEDDIFEREDGSIEWTRWECRPWYEADGSIGGIIVYTEVITKFKQTELELIKARDKAEESDSLKTAFLRNMSHEIRTPLNAIVGFSQILSKADLSDEKRKEFSRLISLSSDKLTEIITDVTEVSKFQLNQIEIRNDGFSIGKCIDGLVEPFYERAKNKGISLLCNKHVDNELIIYSDRRKIEKIFSHLIDNAIKFTHSGSVEIIVSAKSKRLIFTIKDTGIGIADDLQGIVFEPFRQVENQLVRNHGGNGLGLAIVKSYAELLNGKISLSSKIDEGTTITVAIPIPEHKQSLNAEDVVLGSIPQNQHKKDTGQFNILIAEDEYLNYLFLNELLQSEKTKTFHAVNGEAAVNICRTNEDIDLVLMDIKMPVMDGVTAARLIKESRPEMKIIAQTAYSFDSDKIDFTVFDDYLSKPIRQDVLRNKLSKFIAY